MRPAAYRLLLHDAVAPAVRKAAADNSLSAQSISMVAWSFARAHERRAGDKYTHMYEALASAVPLRIQDFCPQEVSNTAWGFGRGGAPARPQLFAVLASRAIPLLRDYKPVELSNLVYGFALAGVAADHEQLFTAFASAALARVGSFSPQQSQTLSGRLRLPITATPPCSSRRAARARWRSTAANKSGGGFDTSEFRNCSSGNCGSSTNCACQVCF